MHIAILPLLTAAAATQCPAATEADIRSTFNQWVKAYVAHDLDRTMAIFDPTAHFEFQGAPDGGITELKESYKEGFAQQQGASWTPKWDQVLVSGNLAAAFSVWTAEVRKADGTTKVLAHNRSVDVLQRGPDCTWRIVRSLTYPLSAAAPGH